MDDRMKLSIGAWEMEADKQFAREKEEQPAPVPVPEARPAEAARPAAAPLRELIEVFETMKRQDETLRDLIIEVRLLYHSLPDKDRKRLEALRDQTTRQVQEQFAAQMALLDGKIAQLRNAAS